MAGGPTPSSPSQKDSATTPRAFWLVIDSQNACIRSVSLDGAQLPFLMQPQKQLLHLPCNALKHSPAPFSTSFKCLLNSY